MNTTALAAGVGLSVLGGVVRIRAWHNALREVAPDVRYRDVVFAHLGGAGFNGIIPAHGGDAVKLALVKRRHPGARLGRLLGSLAPPAAVEAVLTSLIIAWALTIGLLSTPEPGQIPLPLVGAAAAIAAAVLWLLARRAPRLLRDVGAGMAALRNPVQLLRGIVPWVLLARLMRLAALACFIAAVGLPVTLMAALLVMAVQGGVGSGGPASSALRVAVLAATLPAALHVHVSLHKATELLGTQLAVSATNLTISVAVLGATLRTISPRRLVGYCREQARTARRVPQHSRPPSAAPSQVTTNL